MANYTWKMWNIPGDRARDVDGLGRSLPARLHAGATRRARARAARLRSAEVRGSHAGQGHRVSGLPDSTAGTRCGARWSPGPRWSATASSGFATSTSSRTCSLASGEKYFFADYHTVFCSIDIDELWGEDTLPYTGRMMIPLLIPGLAQRVSRRRRVAALLVVRVPDARHRDEGHHAARQSRHADPDRSAGPAGRGRSRFPQQHHRLRARAQPVRREGLPAAVGTGVRDVSGATSIAARRFRTCATSGGTPSSSTGACRKRSTPPIRRRWPSRRCDAIASSRRRRRTSASRCSPTLEVFARLGLTRSRSQPAPLHRRGRLPVDAAAAAVAANGQRVWVGVGRLVRLLP